MELELVCSFGREVLLRGHCDTLFGLDGIFLSFDSAFCCLVLYVVFCFENTEISRSLLVCIRLLVCVHFDLYIKVFQFLVESFLRSF